MRKYQTSILLSSEMVGRQSSHVAVIVSGV